MFFPKKIVIGSLNFSKICEVPSEEDSLPRGIDGGLAILLSQALGFEYTFSIPKPFERTWGFTAPDGNSTGLLGMVQRGEVDIGMCYMGMTQSRQEVIDFTDWYWTDDVTFATHLPSFLPRTLIYTLPFQQEVWMSILLTVLFLSFLMSAMPGFNRSPTESLFELYANVLNQSLGSSHHRRHLVLRGCWWAFALVVSFSYKAVVQSFLAVPLRSTPLKDFEDLSTAVLNGEYRSIGPISEIKNFLRQTNKTHLVALSDRMVRDGSFLPLSEYNNDANIKDKTAVVSTRLLLNFRFGEPPLSTMHIAQDIEVRIRVAMAVAKNFCCLDALNIALRKVLHSGLYYKLMNDEEFKSWMAAMKALEDQDPHHSITLEDISGALAVLVTGILLATIALILEILVGKWKQSYCLFVKCFKNV